MGKIIAFANQKGGVAKTTTAHNIGVCLAGRSKSVLMVDLDSQASLTISTGLEPEDFENNIVSVLEKSGLPAGECVHQLEPSLFIIPSIIDLASLEMDMLSRTSREKILARALEPVRGNYDYILIDCPPQLSILTINALSCADEAIIPVKTDYLAYRGLVQLQDTIAETQKLINQNLRVLGVIATLYEMRVTVDKEILERLQREYTVLGVIKKMAAAKKGIYDGRAVVESEPSSDIAKAYEQITDKILQSEGVQK